MAIPLMPAEIWASKDVILPVAKGPNRVRPITDLWEKGWDESEKPAAEELNYVLNMVTHWLNYISGEQIPGLGSLYLMKQNNLSDIADRSIARLNLDVFSKGESETRYVNTSGDVMSGPLTVPRLEFPNGGTDYSYITTTVGADQTNFDFVLGDNFGPAGSVGVDTFRWRFLPSGGQIFNMMELNAINGSQGLLNVAGNINASNNVTSNSMNAVTGVFTNMTVHGTISTNTVNTVTVNTTNVNAGDRVQAGQIIGNNSITAPYARINGENNTNTLVVNNQWAVVAGRHIVRTVNGVGANQNGDLWINVGGFVSNVRLGGAVWMGQGGWRGNYGGSYTGWVITAYESYGNSRHYAAEIRPIQVLIDGNWYTIGQL